MSFDDSALCMSFPLHLLSTSLSNEETATVGLIVLPNESNVREGGPLISHFWYSLRSTVHQKTEGAIR